MTEAEWLFGTDPQPMLRFLQDQASSRKLRLFAVACCRRIWPFLADARSRSCVDVAERFADGKATDQERQETYSQALFPVGGFFGSNDHHLAFAALCASRAAIVSSPALDFRVGVAMDIARDIAAEVGAGTVERDAQCSLLRYMFGNPFRPVTIDPAWLAWNDGAIPKLAQAMYDERGFDRMSVLAYFLAAAGCTNEDILAHCRSGGEHVRGCWVVDLLLGKE